MTAGREDRGLVTASVSARRGAAVALTDHGAVNANTVTAAVRGTATMSLRLVTVTARRSGTVGGTVSGSGKGSENTAVPDTEQHSAHASHCYGKYSKWGLATLVCGGMCLSGRLKVSTAKCWIR